MNTINQTIPATFSPETTFAIALGKSSLLPDPDAEVLLPFRFALPGEEAFAQRGIPESALHD